LADDRQAGQSTSPASYAPRTLKWELEKTGHRERLPAEDCLRIILSLTAGLEELHNGGLIHRDIKPANIIFVKGESKLADIGLVTSKDLTRTIVSTPGYYREGETQSERSDIYGLGKVLYEMLTGLDRRDDVDFPRLPEGIWGWADRQLALGLNEVVSKACARSPRKRYQSAGEMRADLELLKQGKSVRNGLKRALAPLRSPLSTAVLVTLLLLLGLVGWKWGWKLGSARQDLAPVKRGLAGATKDDPWANSLGMKFVPVPGTKALFCIWNTRVQDFEAFAKATGYDATNGMSSLRSDGWKERGDTWHNPGFAQGATHPVCGVNWQDAKAFCDWLTRTERASGQLGPDQAYRLPIDAEWSRAVGLPEESGSTPYDKSVKIKGIYPWGAQWPPPAGAGNFAGEDSDTADWPSDRPPISGYQDGYPRTSPAGSFKPNAYGLYDMGGNVWQWCEDWCDAHQNSRVLRGASWCDFEPGFLMSSSRIGFSPETRIVHAGFRCVLGTAEGSPAQVDKGLSEQPLGASPTRLLVKNQPPTTATAGPPQATKRPPWTNSLGMKFLPVPGTKALFCVWDTRLQDFEAFVSATGYDATQGMLSQVGNAYKQQGDTWKSPGFGQGPAHPVCGVGWSDAGAFCRWLTQKERKTGLISEGQSYRLPTDAEWSIAVGLGQESATTPKDKDRKNRDVFPWGTRWPPPRGTGNYHPSERLDSYPRTSPVGSFEANRYGLYDMGGNVRNWCEDEYAPGNGNRVLRGASWGDYGMGSLLSSRRFNGAPDFRLVRNGFRCVLATTDVSPERAVRSLSK
jgi:formylglycine-generating enzyme required for sulfatase activity